MVPLLIREGTTTSLTILVSLPRCSLRALLAAANFSSLPERFFSPSENVAHIAPVCPESNNSKIFSPRCFIGALTAE